MLQQAKTLVIKGERRNVNKFIEEQLCSPFHDMKVRHTQLKYLVDIPSGGYFTLKQLNGIIINCCHLEFPAETGMTISNINHYEGGEFKAVNSINFLKTKKHDIVTYTIPNIQYSKCFSLDNFLQLASRYKVFLSIQATKC